MSLTDMHGDYQAALETEARKHTGRVREVLKVGADVFNRQIGHGSSSAKQFAIEKAITAMRAYARKSEAEATLDSESHDFDIGPETQGQRADAATRALQVQGLAQAATRRLQSIGVDSPTDADVERAIADVLNVSITSFEGTDGQTRVDSNPAVAARSREMGDSSIWIDMSSPYQLERPPTDVEAVISNFEGLRNIGYTAGRSAMPEGTSFSGGTGGSLPVVPAGTSEGPTVAGASIQAIAQAAYAAGVAAAGSNFAKRKR